MFSLFYNGLSKGLSHFASGKKDHKQKEGELLDLITSYDNEVNDSDAQKQKIMDLAKDGLGQYAIYIAVAQNKLNVVTFLLAKNDLAKNQFNIDINHLYEDNLTLLHSVIKSKNPEMIKLLVEQGANVNKEGEGKLTPLHYVCYYLTDKEQEILELFKNNKANINAKNTNGDTPLHYACAQKHAKSIEFLLGCDGIKINVQDEKGDTPLHYACSQPCLEIVKSLLIKGARIDIKNLDNQAPLDLVSKSDKSAIGEFLKKRILDSYNKEEETKQKIIDFAGGGWGQDAIYIAVQNNELDIVQHLLAKNELGKNQFNIDINHLYKGNVTLLHSVIKSKNPEMIKLLIEKGADVNKEGEGKLTPLHYVCDYLDDIQEQELDKILKLFKDKGAKINAVSEDGRVPLHYACYKGHEKLVQFLIGCDGIKINVQDAKGKAPLHYACDQGHTRSVQFLIGCDGLNINVQDDKGNTPFHYICDQGHEKLAKYLLDHHEQCDNIHININAQDDTGNTPLHLACAKGYVGIINLLLKQGAEIDIKNLDNQAPLGLVPERDATVISEIFHKHILERINAMKQDVEKLEGYIDEQEPVGFFGSIVDYIKNGISAVYDAFINKVIYHIFSAAHDYYYKKHESDSSESDELPPEPRLSGDSLPSEENTKTPEPPLLGDMIN